MTGLHITYKKIMLRDKRETRYLSKLEKGKYRQILLLRLFQNDPTIKPSFTVIIIICAISSCQKNMFI